MAVNLDVRIASSENAEEIYISAVPEQKDQAKQLAEEIYRAIKDTLTSMNAHILQERIFGTETALQTALTVRSNIFSNNDGVDPSLLVCLKGLNGSLAGIQLHAVKCLSEPKVVNLNGRACGRVVEVPGCRYLALSGIHVPNETTSTSQAKAMLEKAELAIKQFGGDFHSVPRTWMWLTDILDWYDDFNTVRNQFFHTRGIIGNGHKNHQPMPASTGIGLGNIYNGKCAMDLVAVLEPANNIEYLQVGGRQHSAFEYGSAFSRAASAITPAGRTVYISGTASIDENGITTNINDPEAQVHNTIDNVIAALKDMKCDEDDVVQVIAYCKTIEVEKIFNDFKGKYDWPWVTMICDICRDDLLFEIEVTAITK